MMEYDNTNRGSIWKNEKKETEKHPDFMEALMLKVLSIGYQHGSASRMPA